MFFGDPSVKYVSFVLKMFVLCRLINCRANTAFLSPASNDIVCLISSWSCGDAHVYSHQFSCLKHVFAMGKLLTTQISMRRSPASFLNPWSKFPTRLDSVLFPTLCVPSTYNYQRVLFWCVINFFLDTCRKVFDFIFCSPL